MKSPSAFRGKIDKHIGKMDLTYGKDWADNEHSSQNGVFAVDVNPCCITAKKADGL